MKILLTFCAVFVACVCRGDYFVQMTINNNSATNYTVPDCIGGYGVNGVSFQIQELVGSSPPVTDSYEICLTSVGPSVVPPATSQVYLWNGVQNGPYGTIVGPGSGVLTVGALVANTPTSGNYQVNCSYTLGGSGCYKTVTRCTQNNDALIHHYSLGLNNGDGTTSLFSGDMYLAPGQSGCLTANVDCTNADAVKLFVYLSEATGGVPIPTVQAVPNATDSIGPGNPGTSTNYDSPVEGTFTNGNPFATSNSYAPPTLSFYNPTNNAAPILWSASTNDTQTAANALYDAITKGTAQAQKDAGIIEGELTNLHVIGGTNIFNGASNVNVLNWPAGLTNGLGSGGTNELSLTNYNLETTQRGISNLLATLTNGDGMTLEQYTNEANRDMLQLSNGGFNFAQTNGAGVVSDALTPLKDSFGDPSAAPGLDTPAGPGDSTGIPLGGGIVIHINPVTMSANLGASFEAARVVAGLMILCLLVWKNYKQMVGALRTTLLVPQATTAGGSILGTNINTPSAVIMAAAIVAVAASVPTLCVPLLTGQIGEIVAAGGTLLDGGAGKLEAVSAWGWGFVNYYFPVALLCAAVANRFAFSFFIDLLESVGLAIVKFLTGI